MGPHGILPAAGYLQDVANYYPGLQRFWFAPTLLWLGAANHALMLITWVGMVGPGIQRGGIDKTTWTDHTNLRPTMLSLLGLKDDYVDDGHVLIQALTKQALPSALGGPNIAQLADAYEQVNAPFGAFAAATLKASTTALKSTDDTQYTSLENSIAKRVIAGEQADVQMSERHHNRAREGGGVHQVGAALLAGVGEGIGEDEPAFGICIDDFDGFAGHGRDNIARALGAAARHVFHARHERGDGNGGAKLR